MNYQDCIAEIASFEGRGIHCNLDRMSEACAILDNPQNCFKSVHIAGTNGKGSTSVICAEILKTAGYKTGLTISPHVEDYRERIQINGRWISEEALISLHESLKKKAGHIPLTYFEWTILLAFLYFAESKVDIAVLETGMGGRWDATNTVTPLVAAITNVSHDHQEYLGETLEKILTEKMQIIKKGCVAWTGIEEEELLAILKTHCRETPLSVLKDYLVENPDGSFSIFDFQNLHCALLGNHQHKNAGLALGILKSMTECGFEIPQDAIRKGLSSVKWPGRLEIVSTKPFILLDCAHNPEGIETLVEYLMSFDWKNQKFHLVFGCLKDRPFDAMLTSLLPFASQIHLALFEEKRSFSRGELEVKVNTLGKNNAPVSILEVNFRSWEDFIKTLKPEEAVVVTGSLYLVSQVRALMRNKS